METIKNENNSTWRDKTSLEFAVKKYAWIMNLDEKDAVEDIGLLESLPNVAFLMITSELIDLQFYQGFSAVLRRYTEIKNRLSPSLVAILEADYGNGHYPPHWLDETEMIVANMISRNELDLTTFKDKDGVVSFSRVFNKRNIFVFYPLPFYMGSIDSLRKRLPTMRMQARVNIDDAVRVIREKGVGIEGLRSFVARVEERHKERKGKVVPRRLLDNVGMGLDYNRTYLINYNTKKITRLEPYADEFRSLLDVSVSWSFLRQFVNAVNNAIGDTGTKPSTGKYDGGFAKMFNTVPTNTLLSMNFSGAKTPTFDEIKSTTEHKERTAQYNLYTNKWEYKDKRTEILVPATPDEIKLLQQKQMVPSLPLFNNVTWRLMLFLNICFTQQNTRRGNGDINNVVESTVIEFMNTTRVKTSTANIKKTNLRVKQELERIGRFQIKHNDKKYSLEMVTPFPEVKLERGRIRVTFAPSYANYLVKITGFLTTFPLALLQGDVKNPNFLPLGYYLAWYRSYDNNIRMGKANIISVASCLEKCPCIPSIDTVKAWNGSPFYKIILPFCDTMDLLEDKGVLKSWEFCGAKGVPIPRATVDKFDYFSELYILFEIKDFPVDDEVARIQEHDEKKRRRKERQERFADKIIAERKVKKTENQ